MTSALNAATIGQAPKVLLHDHLDGGMRAATLLELADELGYENPAGIVPHFERADGCRGQYGRAPFRCARPLGIPRDGQHRQPAVERHHIPFDERLSNIEEVISPRFSALIG
jgi:hypothetical protein